MALSRHTSRIYMDEFDIQGAIKVIGDEITEAKSQREQDVLCGMHLALSLIFNHDELRDQSVFMALAHEQMASAGIIETKGKHHA